ncbi:hypothetical protein KAFR_0I00840 [Kazachstania africana CBS 2517]|uniref:Histone-binding protein RBBP4-like N-terminal domain-containing protein n=1 Tax=Kazachstania africana (strain ATCC 22294 / BCRC 22015 / CBS 2517 / CECT 1963 / NBRC 1671 / NRRL Y-8276) TaxID=1071382 RepID=H2AZR5_KAZAF|nr:hypothetical protein KAFR_0I00840 [Kazachstania africana CBS 2517]CCF59865.1 hypothetical protein KAFR_0I00840 [Kazachstania africana CBS 2517]
MTTDAPIEPSSIPDDLQERYSRWKKNTKLLYSYLNTNTSKWPSLTCQFFPDLDTTTDTHRILLSTFTSSQLPEDESLYIANLSTSNHLNWSSLNNFDMDEMEFKPDNSTKFPSKNLNVDISIPFPNGDCNRARYLPQNPDLLAAASSNGSIYIFNRTKHGSRRLNSNQRSFEARLYSTDKMDENFTNSNEAVSIAWNLQKNGTLASSYSQGSIKIWDITKYSCSDPTLRENELTIPFDPEGCNEVTWMVNHDSIFAACSESNKLSLFDVRTKEEMLKMTENIGTHSGGINSCKFNYYNDMLLASADSTGKINMWDIRKLDKEPIKSFNHNSSISTLEWNPNLETILVTAGQDDGLVKIWDTANGQNIFVHGGHMLGVNDVSWDLHDPWLLSSVSNDNSIHVWKPATNLVDIES